MSYTPQAKTLALLPKFTGFLSLLGSSFIFQDVMLNKRSSSRVYHRLVLGLSCSDMTASIVNILSTWPIPEGSNGVYLASGTTGTCTAQGFFNELGNLATPLYNASLCVYYVLVVRDGWAEEKIRREVELFMHIVPTMIASLIAVLGLPFKLYNNSGWLCWIAAFPSGCQSSEEGCIRGQHADTFRWVHYAIIWSAILFVSLGMHSIYRKVRRQEKITMRYRRQVRSREALNSEGVLDAGAACEEVERGRGNVSKSRKVALQAALFIGALYLTWFFTTIARIYQITTGKNNFALLVLMATFFPLQGFFNALIYIRPRYLRCKSRNPDKSFLKVFLLALRPEGQSGHIRAENQNAVSFSPYPANQAGDPERRRRSSTASFYSMGNSRKKSSAMEDSQSDDALFSVNTENARAEEADFHSDSSYMVKTSKEQKAVLDSVAEDDRGESDDFENV